MKHLGFFPAIAAALPGEHRSLVAMFFGVFPGPIQATTTVKQNRPGRIREMHVVERKDVQFIPEDVAAISFAMQPSGRDADIKINVVWGSSDHAVVLIEP